MNTLLTIQDSTNIDDVQKSNSGMLKLIHNLIEVLVWMSLAKLDFC